MPQLSFTTTVIIGGLLAGYFVLVLWAIHQYRTYDRKGVIWPVLLGAAYLTAFGGLVWLADAAVRDEIAVVVLAYGLALLWTWFLNRYVLRRWLSGWARSLAFGVVAGFLLAPTLVGEVIFEPGPLEEVPLPLAVPVLLALPSPTELGYVLRPCWQPWAILSLFLALGSMLVQWWRARRLRRVNRPVALPTDPWAEPRRGPRRIFPWLAAAALLAVTAGGLWRLDQWSILYQASTTTQLMTGGTFIYGLMDVEGSTALPIPPARFAVTLHHIVRRVPKMGSWRNPDTGRGLMHAAALYGGAADVALLVRAGVAVDAQDERGNTPLCLAVRNPRPDVIGALVDAGADVNAKGASSLTPIMTAAMAGKVDALRLLLARGAGVQVRWVPAHSGEAVIRELVGPVEAGGAKPVSAEVPAKPTVHPLIRAARDARKWALGVTALHLAASTEKTEVVRLLLDAGAEADVKTDEGVTPLFVAAAKGRTDTAKLLLAAGADVNAAATTGDTPLHAAAAEGHLETVAVLLQAGAGVNTMNRQGQTPVDAVEWLAQRPLPLDLFGGSRNQAAEKAERERTVAELRRLLEAHGGKSGKDLTPPAAPASAP